MATENLVSVLLCSYNASEYIGTTLRSISNQTYENMEILVLDNNSSDDTTTQVRAHASDDRRVELFESETNLGAYDGLNYLLERAEGDYVAIQDHDDIWHEQKVELQVEELNENPEYVGCGGNTIKLWEGTNNMHRLEFDKIGRFSPHPSLMFRNEGFRYDTSLNYKTDTYFMRSILCQDGRKLYNIQKPLYISLVRDDDANMTKFHRPLRDVFQYALRAREPKLFLNQFLHYLSPTKPYPANNIDALEREGEFEDVQRLADSEFTRQYLRYIERYVKRTLSVQGRDSAY